VRRQNAVACVQLAETVKELAETRKRSVVARSVVDQTVEHATHVRRVHDPKLAISSVVDALLSVKPCIEPVASARNTSRSSVPCRRSFATTGLL
jgi:hypothetical protein